MLLSYLLVLITLISCRDKMVQQKTFTANVPIYMSKEDFRSSVFSKPAQPIQNPGKIFFHQQYLLIGDKEQGIHIIDNSNPSNPFNLTYINIPGNIDFYALGDRLFADSFTDLVEIDIHNFNAIKEVQRKENVFHPFFPEYNTNYPLAHIRDTSGVIVGWRVDEITETYDSKEPIFYDCMGCDVTLMETSALQSTSSVNSTAVRSKAGSMARFSIANDYLYALDNWKMHIIDINDFNQLEEVLLNRSAETLFKNNNHLFIGTTSGMMIYNIEDAANPNFVSTYEHVRSCDPVVVKENHAFVTLRSGTMCQGFTNNLEVIDISNLSNPQLIKSYEMHNPHGLGIDNNTLFLCDGNDGLKIYDIEDVTTITDHQLKHFDNINGFDVIPLNNTLMLIGEDGLYQYDYSSLDQVNLISSIPVNTLNN